MHNIPFEKIEQYMHGEMSAEEQLLFEKQLAADKELNQAFDLYKKIENEMRTDKEDADKTALEDSLQQLNKIYFKKNQISNSVFEVNAQSPAAVSVKRETFHTEDRKTVNINLWKQLAIAASITGVIALGVIIYKYSITNNQPLATNNKKTDSSKNSIKKDTSQIQKNIIEQNLANQNKNDTNKVAKQKQQLHTNSNHEVLFANNFKPDTIPESTTGPLEDAFAYYENRDYKNAIASIESADLNTELRGQETDTKHIIFYAHYYKALSYLVESNVAKAITELNYAIKESPDSVLQIKAQWYLALAYLKSDDIEKAEKLLTKIVSGNQESAFKPKAFGLLTDFKKH